MKSINNVEYWSNTTTDKIRIMINSRYIMIDRRYGASSSVPEVKNEIRLIHEQIMFLAIIIYIVNFKNIYIYFWFCMYIDDDYYFQTVFDIYIYIYIYIESHVGASILRIWVRICYTTKVMSYFHHHVILLTCRVYRVQWMFSYSSSGRSNFSEIIY